MTVLFILGANLKYSIDWLKFLAEEKAAQGEIKKREGELKDLSTELISNSVETQPAWAEFLIDLANLVPEDVSLNSLTVKKAGKRYQGEFTGLIQGRDKVDSFFRAEELRIFLNRSSALINPNLERKLDGEILKFKANFALKG